MSSPTAVLDETGQTFEDVEVARMAANDAERCIRKLRSRVTRARQA